MTRGGKELANIPGWEITQEHHDTFNLARLGAVDTALVAGQYRRVGLYTCPAATAVGAGYGDLAGQETAEGRIYFNAVDDAAPGVAFDGYVRLSVLDPQQRVLATIYQGRTEDLRLGAADQRLRRVLKEIPQAWITQDYSMELQINPDAAVTFGAANSTLLMSVTSARARRA